MPNDDLSVDPLIKDLPVREGYKVLGSVVLYQKLGQGGMGAVYRGRHLRLDIDVAVKVMAPPPSMSQELTDDFTRRFVREARTAAAVGHPNLIRVYDVNSESGIHYLIMDFIEGESAGERLERKGQLGEAEALKIALGAADGLAEAHAKGIVHRDVKPDNILIDARGRVVVADLGLAKAFDENESNEPSMLTQTQTAMGTPCYMPPEQFASARSVGPAADVWSLGATLYHLLTGQLPWSDSSVFGLAKKIESDPLPDPKSVRAGLCEGSCAILAKALQKTADERYKDCGEMARALRLQLTEIESAGDVTLIDAAGRKPSTGKVTPPPARTLTLIAASELAGSEKKPDDSATQVAPQPEPAAKRSSVGTILIALLVLAGLAAGGAYLFTENLKTVTHVGIGPAPSAEGEMTSIRLDAGGAAPTRTDELAGETKEIRMALEKKLAKAKQDERILEERALEEKHARAAAAIEAANEAANELTTTGNNKEAIAELEAALDLVPEETAAVQILPSVKGPIPFAWEKSGKITLDAHDEKVSSMTFSPDGLTLVTGSADATAIMWDIRDGSELRVLKKHSSAVTDIRYSPDGSMLVTASFGDAIGLWDAATGENIALMRGHTGNSRCAAFSHDGKRVVSAGSEKAVFIWDVKARKMLKKIGPLRSTAFCADYSPDGRFLAIACFAGFIEIWDATSDKKLRKLLGHKQGSLWVRFSPDGKTLISFGHDNQIVQWNPETGEEVKRFPKKHTDGVTAAVFSPDGKLLVTGGYKGEVIYWDFQSATFLHKEKPYYMAIAGLAISPDGRAIGMGAESSRALVTLIPKEVIAAKP